MFHFLDWKSNLQSVALTVPRLCYCATTGLFYNKLYMLLLYKYKDKQTYNKNFTFLNINCYKKSKKNTLPSVGQGSKPSMGRPPERGTSLQYAPSQVKLPSASGSISNSWAIT